MGKRWLPLESNPEVLNEFAAKVGMKSEEYRFCDVYGLDPVRLNCRWCSTSSRYVCMRAAPAADQLA